MPNDQEYKEMYLTMAREVEKAVRVLIDAQQKCEEMYLQAKDEEEQKHPCGNCRRDAFI